MAKAKKPRTEAQIEATKKLVAFNKKRRAAANKQLTLAGVEEKGSKAKKTRSYTLSDKGKTTKVIYKRNPIDTKRAKGMFAENIKPSAVGAVGALGIDLVWGKVPIPASMRVGFVKYPVKAALAIGLGMVAEKVLPKNHQKHAVDLVRGSLTVIMHEAAKNMLQTRYPSLALAAYEQDELAEIIADEQLNGFVYDQAGQAHQTMGETLRLDGLAAQDDFYVPQYHGTSY